MNSKPSLPPIRNQINNIDKKIVYLLAERKKLIFTIAASKIQNNQEIRDIEREKKLLHDLINYGKKYHLTSEYITCIFQIIIEESVLTQQMLLQQFYNNNKIYPSSFSFLGPNGSYSHIALNEYAQRNCKKYIEKECSTFEEVLLSVENNYTDCAIVPIENNSSGVISEVLSILKNINLFIIGEINICVNHCLLGLKNAKLKNIKTIYSHPQPFKQCSNFIRQFSHWKIKYSKSTTDAIRTVAQYKDITNAALGSAIGGNIYKLNILATNVTNQEKNITRFILLSKNKINISPQIPAKTTIIFNKKNTSNDLVKILILLQKNNITVKTISSKIKQNNLIEEVVYVDIPLNISSSLMQDIIKKVIHLNTNIKILGCYPSAKIIPAVL
ncbi:chorismate mutase [Buchnera aphidicola]|uniref:chorismate mutase n=1 Tax=Buchnera aphidicola TaxID=9 RepID=UPI003464AC16